MSVGVFCGARHGLDPAFAEATREVARLLAARGHRIIYGGGNVGLMGVLADAAVEAGAEIIGVIPRDMTERELAHTRLTELRIVETMAERKAVMAELSDAFLALPGGVGTLDELFEMVTWNQLNFQRKPVALLNVRGFYDHLWSWILRCREDRFILDHTFDLLTIDDDAGRLIESITRRGGPRR